MGMFGFCVCVAKACWVRYRREELFSTCLTLTYIAKHYIQTKYRSASQIPYIPYLHIMQIESIWPDAMQNRQRASRRQLKQRTSCNTSLGELDYAEIRSSCKCPEEPPSARQEVHLVAHCRTIVSIHSAPPPSPLQVEYRSKRLGWDGGGTTHIAMQNVLYKLRW